MSRARSSSGLVPILGRTKTAFTNLTVGLQRDAGAGAGGRPALRSTRYGIFNMVGCLAGGLMAPLAGWIWSSIGMAGAFEFASAVLFVSTLLMFRLRMPARPGSFRL